MCLCRCIWRRKESRAETVFTHPFPVSKHTFYVSLVIRGYLRSVGWCVFGPQIDQQCGSQASKAAVWNHATLGAKDPKRHSWKTCPLVQPTFKKSVPQLFPPQRSPGREVNLSVIIYPLPLLIKSGSSPVSAESVRSAGKVRIELLLSKQCIKQVSFSIVVHLPSQHVRLRQKPSRKILCS